MSTGLYFALTPDTRATFSLRASGTSQVDDPAMTGASAVACIGLSTWVVEGTTRSQNVAVGTYSVACTDAACLPRQSSFNEVLQLEVSSGSDWLRGDGLPLTRPPGDAKRVIGPTHGSPADRGGAMKAPALDFGRLQAVAAADIAPHFLALLDRHGVVQMLARVGTFTGDRCFGIAPVPAAS